MKSTKSTTGLRAICTVLLVLSLAFSPLATSASFASVSEDTTSTQSAVTPEEPQPQAEEPPAHTEKVPTQGKSALNPGASLAGFAPMSVANPSGDKLQLLLGDTSNGFVDVDTMGNATTWPLTTIQKQIQVKGTFSGVASAKARTIEVKIPRGYKILEYSAKSGTAAISGVTQLQLSSENDAKVTSSALTALDGASWAAQRITGYTGSGVSTDANYRTYDGKVLYAFNSNCDDITLTLTLGLDQTVMSHAATTYILQDLTAKLTSGSETLDTHLTTTVSQLIVPTSAKTDYQTQGGSRTISGDPVTGAVDTFATGWVQGSWLAATGVQNHFAETGMFTVTYPAGVTFQGFNDKKTSTDRPTDATGGTYAGGHLVVTNNTATRTVTFTYDKVTVRHSNGEAEFICYWAADMNAVVGGTWDGSDKVINFPATWNESSGALSGSPAAQTPAVGTVIITVGRPSPTNLTLTPQNRVRRDLNTAGDYPYEYLLSQIVVTNPGPNKATGLTYTWEFDDTLGVRAVSFPALSGAADNVIYGVKASVKNGAGVTRTIDLGDSLTLTTAPSLNVVFVRAETLGLAADEHIVTLSAKQAVLDAGILVSGNTNQSGNYYGRFQSGQTGEAKLTITGDGGFSASKTDQPTIGWSISGAGSLLTTARHSNNTSGSFYPGEAMNFTSTCTAGAAGTPNSHIQDLVDPTIVISLPEGITLDQTTIKGISKAGNYTDGSEFALRLVGMSTQMINGIEWTTYRYTSQNHQDMIANSKNMGGAAVQDETITVKFTANVSSSCQAYPELKAQDLVMWDLGKTAITAYSNANYTVDDTYDRAGKGTTYKTAGATQSPEIKVVQKPGLTVGIGIRSAGSGSAFYTYDGTQATVAPVTPSQNAEIQLTYKNTSDSAYFSGSEIYLPIPKMNHLYGNYFNNAASDPYNVNDIKTPEYSMSLTGAVSLPGFDTLYAFDTSGAVNSGTVDNSWTPVSYTFYPAGSFPVGKTFADVTMMKFVANVQILADAGNSTTFQVAVNTDATLAKKNFWRSYQKGWRAADGTGTWVYGSVIAAEPTKAGVLGMVFNDANANGTKDAGETFTNPGGKVTAILTEKAGGIVPLEMTIDSTGAFASKNANGSPYQLKVGNYVVTINNADVALGFTPVTPALTRSDGTGWFMDIAQAKITANHASAVYEFSVTTGSALSSEYVGVGLKAASLVTYKAGTGITGWPGTDPTEYVRLNNSPVSAPSLTAAHASTGYDITTQKWKLDKAVTLTDGTVIPANTAMTRAQLYLAKITEAVTATVSLDLATYTLTASVAGNVGGVISMIPALGTVSHGSPVMFSAVATSGYEIDWMTANATTVTPTTVGNTSNYSIASVISNQSVIVKFRPISYTIGYDLGGGSVATPNPTSYTIETASFTLNNPTKLGYTFLGWTGPNGSTPQTSVSVPTGSTGNRKYTANWAAATNTAYTVEHYKEQPGGTFTRADTENFTGTTDTTATATAKTTYTNYYVDTTHPDRVPSGVIAANGSLVLKLYYKLETYRVTYVGCGATSGVVPTDAANYRLGQAAAVRECTPLAKAGYSFAGWSTEEPISPFSVLATPTVYQPQDSLEPLADALALGTKAASDPHYTIPLYATWSADDQDLMFDSQGATQASLLDILTLPTPTDSLVKQTAHFPTDPTRTGHVFRGWKMPDTSWVTAETTMPPQSTLLTASWERGTVVVVGDTITIVASPFALSMLEAQAHQGKTPAERLAELVARGYARAWYSDTLEEVPVTAAAVTPSRGDGKSIDAITGAYDVTFFAGSGADEVSVSVKAHVFDQVGPASSSIGANNFTRNVKAGSLSAADAIRLAGATVFDEFGTATGEVPAVDATQLATINAAIAAKRTGSFPLTFTNEGEDTVTITVALTKDADPPVVVPPTPGEETSTVVKVVTVTRGGGAATSDAGLLPLATLTLLSALALGFVMARKRREEC